MGLVVYAEHGERVELGTELDRGGEGAIYPLVSSPLECAKIYTKTPTSDALRKLRLMAGNPPRDPSYEAKKHRSISWPSRLLFADSACSRWLGFVMPRIDVKRFRKALSYVVPSDRNKLFGGGFTWHHLSAAALNVASAVAALHEAGYCVGDLNESNILIAPNALITLIDCDSFQVLDASTGRVYRCQVGKGEYTAPELQGKTFKDVDRTPETDCFALGVLLFQLLMEGTHPYQARGRLVEDAPSPEAKIVKGHYPYDGRAGVDPPEYAPPYELLDPTIRELFRRCFADGHKNPSARPSAGEWFATLRGLANRFARCRSNENHVFLDHLGSCPWCRIASATGRDPYPSPIGQQVALDDPTSGLDSLDKKLNYLGSYVSMALADGVLSSEEEEYIAALGVKLQIPRREVERFVRSEMIRNKTQVASSIGSPPVLEVSKTHFQYDSLGAGAKPVGAFTVNNTGGGTLRGSIKASRGWLKVVQSQLDPSRHRQEVGFSIDTSGLWLGAKDSGTIDVQSNGGIESVRVDISMELPDVVLARYRRQLAGVSALGGLAVGLVNWLLLPLGMTWYATVVVVVLAATLVAPSAAFFWGQGAGCATYIIAWGSIWAIGSEVGLPLLAAVSWGLVYAAAGAVLAEPVFKAKARRGRARYFGLVGCVAVTALILGIANASARSHPGWFISDYFQRTSRSPGPAGPVSAPPRSSAGPEGTQSTGRAPPAKTRIPSLKQMVGHWRGMFGQHSDDRLSVTSRRSSIGAVLQSEGYREVLRGELRPDHTLVLTGVSVTVPGGLPPDSYYLDTIQLRLGPDGRSLTGTFRDAAGRTGSVSMHRSP